jgi:small multidrug resistance family-3 protein
MRYGAALLLLVMAALVEAGGDALIRTGLQTALTTRRAGYLAAGGLLLLGYGCLVNAPPWAFGRLLGVYVVLFFLIAQAIGWMAFGQVPTRGIWLGGLFIAIGGAIITVSSR